MEDEKKVTATEETTENKGTVQTEAPVETKTEKVEEKTETPAPEKEKDVEKPAEKVEEKEVEEKTDATESTVDTTAPTGNGIRIEDLATKDEVRDMLAAFEAKYDAVIKENEDLKKKLGEITEKYEEKDFGAVATKGVSVSDKVGNDNYDEYAKQFM